MLVENVQWEWTRKFQYPGVNGGGKLKGTTSTMPEKPGIERLQALADISRSALYAFVVYNATSLHTCMLSQ